MSTEVDRARGLQKDGIDTDRVHWNLSPAALYEEAIRRQEGVIAAEGPLVCRTGHHTGRSPNDKFVVREPSSEGQVDWGKVNRSMDAAQFDLLHREFLSSLAGRELFVLDCYAGADPARHGTNSEVVIAVNFARRLVLIGGTSYAGEMKKSIFTVLNYLLPLRGVLPMHCSANVGPGGDAALFFGLSGTGKTTLSSDPERLLVGDDEHGWSDHGVFNFEGGCYAKTIRLSPSAEPDIFATTRRFGTVLENVVVDPATRALNLDDDRYTENTRAAYPISFIANAVSSGRGGHPKTVVMLTADAFGVLPPIARLTPEGAMYHFLSGYTAKVAGTEKGVTEPKATFSACFGAPFLPLAPSRYATMLGEKIARHGARVWLVNTGWTGGPYGVGHRMKIAYTRAMIRAALAGALDAAAHRTDPLFNLDIPTGCPGVPTEVLNPRNTWADAAAYDQRAGQLARMFADNFRAFQSTVTPAVAAAGPHV